MAIQHFALSSDVETVLTEIQGRLESGWTVMDGKMIESGAVGWERAWLSHAHFLNSATPDLHLALAQRKRRYGWADGEKVITRPLSS